jgi:hypothetical protein
VAHKDLAALAPRLEAGEDAKPASLGTSGAEVNAEALLVTNGALVEASDKSAAADVLQLARDTVKNLRVRCGPAFKLRFPRGKRALQLLEKRCVHSLLPLSGDAQRGDASSGLGAFYA